MKTVVILLAISIVFASLFLLAYSAPMTVQAGETQGVRVEVSVAGGAGRRAYGAGMNGNPVTSVTVYYTCIRPNRLITVTLYDDAGSTIASGSVTTSSAPATVPVSPNPPAANVARIVATVGCFF